MNRERTKTLILFLLVILSIMSIQKIWFDSPVPLLQTEATSGREQQTKAKDLRNQVISPKKVTVGFGGGTRSENYTIFYTVLNHQEMKDVWQDSKLLLLDFFTGDSEVELISYEEYIENNRRKFIELEFGDNLSSVLVSSIFDVLDSKVIRNIREIKRILIPVNNTGKIYIVGKNDHVFEVRLEEYENDTLEAFILNHEKKDFVRYYTALNASGNQIVVPVNYNMPLHQIFVESEINTKNDGEVMEITKKLFNYNLDFVKTIHETSGSRIFLYGYGEKSVRISNRGHLEYKEEVGNASSTNVMDALSIALNFIKEHGGLPDTIYIDKIDNTIGANKGYYFAFGYSVGGLPVALNNSTPPIEIEVFGNKVKTYRRFIRKEMNLPPPNLGENIMSPTSIIDKNFELLKENYKKDIDSGIEEEVDNNEILRSISIVEIVYRDSLEDTIVTPSWRIGVGDRVYYFDGYKGKLLYYYSTIDN